MACPVCPSMAVISVRSLRLSALLYVRRLSVYFSMFLCRSSCKESSSRFSRLSVEMSGGSCTVSVIPKNPATPFFARVTVRNLDTCRAMEGRRSIRRLSALSCSRSSRTIRSRCSSLLASSARSVSICAEGMKSAHCSRRESSRESVFKRYLR